MYWIIYKTPRVITFLYNLNPDILRHRGFVTNGRHFEDDTLKHISWLKVHWSLFQMVVSIGLENDLVGNRRLPEPMIRWNLIRASGPSEFNSWWRHQMETFSALLVICAGNLLVIGEFPAQRPVTRSFDVFFDLHPNKRLNKQPWGWRFEMPTRIMTSL